MRVILAPRRALASAARWLADRIATPPAVAERCPCLTCRLRAAICEHAEATAGPSGPAVDALGAVSAAAGIIAEIAVRAGDEDLGDMIVETAHSALDAALVNLRTGVPQAVFVGGPPQAVH